MHVYCFSCLQTLCSTFRVYVVLYVFVDWNKVEIYDDGDYLWYETLLTRDVRKYIFRLHGNWARDRTTAIWWLGAESHHAACGAAASRHKTLSKLLVLVDELLESVSVSCHSTCRWNGLLAEQQIMNKVRIKRGDDKMIAKSSIIPWPCNLQLDCLHCMTDMGSCKSPSRSLPAADKIIVPPPATKLFRRTAETDLKHAWCGTSHSWRTILLFIQSEVVTVLWEAQTNV